MALVILVGSTRHAKVEGTREALAAIASVDARFGRVELRAFDVTSVAPRMPMTEAEIVGGARERAAAIVRSAPSGDTWYAVGLEGGLDPVSVPAGIPPGRETTASSPVTAVRYALRSWACVTDGSAWSYGAGGVVLVPDDVAEAVRAGRELGDVVDGHAGAHVRGTRGAWGVLTCDLVTRQDAFRLAVVSAFAPFYNTSLFR